MRVMTKRKAIEEKEAKRRSRMVKAEINFGRMHTVKPKAMNKKKRTKAHGESGTQLSIIDGCTPSVTALDDSSTMSPEQRTTSNLGALTELRFGSSFQHIGDSLTSDQKGQEKRSEMSDDGVDASEIEKKVAALRLEPINIDIETGKAFSKAQPLPTVTHVCPTPTPKRRREEDDASVPQEPTRNASVDEA